MGRRERRPTSHHWTPPSGDNRATGDPSDFKELALTHARRKDEPTASVMRQRLLISSTCMKSSRTVDASDGVEHSRHHLEDVATE